MVIKGAEEDADQLLLTDKLLQAVLAEAQIVCVGQPLLIAGDLNADPAVIPFLAKGISAGEFVDLALAYSLGEERRPDDVYWDELVVAPSDVVLALRDAVSRSCRG